MGIGQPQSSTIAGVGPSRRLWFATSFTVFAGASTLAVLAAWIAFGSLPVAARYVRGERLILEPTKLSLELPSDSTPIVANATIRNFTGSPVRLVGATTRCSCAVAQDLPATIPAGGTFRLPIRVSARSAEESVDEVIVVYTDDRVRPQLTLRVDGEVSTED